MFSELKDENHCVFLPNKKTKSGVSFCWKTIWCANTYSKKYEFQYIILTLIESEQAQYLV